MLTDGGYIVLSEANETTFVTGFDAPPSEAVLFSQNEIDGFYNDVKGISNDYYDPASTQNDNQDGSGEGGGGEGRAQEPGGGGEGEGGEPNLEQLADNLAGLAPAAGGEGEGGAIGEEITLLRVDQNPFRTEPEQQFNLTEIAGDELGDGGEGAGAGGAETTETIVTTEEDDGGSGEGAADPEPDSGTDFSGSGSAVSFTGTDGDDLIVGSSFGDTLSGGAGDDTLDGGAGDDVLDSGDGSDTVIFSDATGGITVNLETGNANGVETVTDSISDVENVVGGAGDDFITGNDETNTLSGGAGDDGNDGLDGAGGDDVFLVTGTGQGFDRVTGGEGFDQILGSDGDDTFGLITFSCDMTVEAIDGGAGENVIEGSNSSNSLDFSGATLTNIARIEGNGGNDVITGSSGADTIVGGVGNDFLDGGDGDDVFLVSGTGQGFDRITGGAGFDQILGSDGDDTFSLISFTGDMKVEAIDGSAGENVIVGSNSSNVMDFSGTTLTNIARIEGFFGNDAITGTTEDDVISGGNGNDFLMGGDGDDTLQGDAGRDRLFGDAGDDRLIVENDDFLMVDGGTGTDTVAIDFNLDLANVIDTRLVNIESFDLRGGSDATLTIGLNDVLAPTDGANDLTGGLDDLVIRRDADDTVNVVGDTWDVSQDDIDTDGDGVTEGYTVFNDAASGATVYVENAQFA